MFKSTKDFVKHVNNALKSKELKKLDLSSVLDFPLNYKQCLYIVDWQSSEIAYQKNIKKILGYEENEFTMQKILEIAHPDDINIVKRLTQAIVNHLIDNKGMQFSKSSLNITYRFKKKDGSYVKLLRQSSFFAKTSDGKFKSNISLLTDISFFDDSDIVQWDFITPKINQEELKKRVYVEFSTLFTKREKEIILEIAKNLTSNEIAEKLFISPHTVLKHRKNILQKAQCNNTTDLMRFCHKVGVL